MKQNTITEQAPQKHKYQENSLTKQFFQRTDIQVLIYIFLKVVIFPVIHITVSKKSHTKKNLQENKIGLLDAIDREKNGKALTKLMRIK